MPTGVFVRTEANLSKLRKWHREHSNPFAGKRHSEASRKKMSIAHKGVPLSLEHRAGLSRALAQAYSTVEGRATRIPGGKASGLKHSAEWRSLQSAKMKALWADPTFRTNITEKARKRGGEASKHMWADPKHDRQRHVQNIVRGWHVRPNKPERELNILLDRLFPGQWRYVGDGSLIIAGLCPDFVNVNGRKQIIELFGDYWHRGEDPAGRAARFVPFGYEALVVWEHELKNQGQLKEKLLAFAGLVR